MGIFKLKPARDAHLDSSQIVADLDAIIATPITFRLAGRIHELKPISLKQYMGFLNKLGTIDSLAKQVNKTDVKMIDTLTRHMADIFGEVCETISIEDVKKMSYAQAVALYSLIIELMQGKLHARVDNEKKNSLAPQTSTSEST